MVSYMVRGSTEAECRRELAWLCQERDAVVTLQPTDRLGAGWIARAVPTTPKTPAGGEGLVER